MTFYNERLELYKGDERFAKIEDGDTLLPNNPFYEQAKEDIELLTRKRVMNSLKKLF